MITECRIALPDQLLLICDAMPPEPIKIERPREQVVSATPQCVAVAALSDGDGHCDIMLLEQADPADQDVVFDDYVETPSHRLALCTSAGTPLLSAQVPSTHTRVQVQICTSEEDEEIHVRIVREDFEEGEKG